MTIKEVYDIHHITEVTTARDQRMGIHRFEDELSRDGFRYKFYTNGMIMTNVTFLGNKFYEMNLRVAEHEREAVRIYGLQRQMKFALPRILARR